VEALLGWLWIMRKGAAAGAALLLFRAAVTYADLGRKAVTMLEDIQRVHRCETGWVGGRQRMWGGERRGMSAVRGGAGDGDTEGRACRARSWHWRCVAAHTSHATRNRYATSGSWPCCPRRACSFLWGSRGDKYPCV
jgi:hypothetical protein